MMDINEIFKEQVLIIELIGRVDNVTSKEFEDCLMKNVENGQYQMAVSFKNVSFISSAGLRVLLMIAKKIKSNRGHIVLYEMSKDVREVFEVSGFSTIFAIKDTERTALDFLAGN